MNLYLNAYNEAFVKEHRKEVNSKELHQQNRVKNNYGG